jgi:DMSO/TMAO reductase YedYZ molybdopterin-dependent catalytic subunit
MRPGIRVPGRFDEPMPRFPTPPDQLRRGPLREGAFRANLHDERTASLIGTALGIAFTLAFATGVVSHELQHPPSWLPLPTRPVWLYWFTQGLHVASGMAAVPLLLAKLWTVYPRLFTWPPATSLVNILERLSIGVLVAGAIFELQTGLLNVVQWYPWPFPFIQSHFWVAWITVGALMLHLAIKAPVIARGYRDRSAEPGSSAEIVPPASRNGWVSRRMLLTSTGVAVGAVTITTVGQSVTSLHSLDLFAPRDPTVGPQHLPINRTAAQAQVLDSAVDPAWRLNVAGPQSYQLTLADLNALPQAEAVLPISCVEGWSVNAGWRGVRVRDLLDRAGVPSDATIRVVSLERDGAYRVTEMQSEYARDPLTLLALRLNGEQLSIDHGFPARVIAPGRPGVLQTKWVARLEVA